MGESSVDPNVLYGFLGFISLVLIAMLVILFRNTRDIGEMKGDIRRLSNRIEEVNANLTSQIESLNSGLTSRIDQVNANLTSRIENLERAVAALTVQFTQLNRELGEFKGTLKALNERLGLMMRHHHDDATGEVLLTPEQVTAD